MPSNAEQNAWVVRVLQVALPRTDSPGGAVLAAAAAPIVLPSGAQPPPTIRYVSVEGRQIWETAREAVFDQFDGLRDRLAAEANPGMAQIADLGLAELTKRVGVQIQVAMMEVDAAPPERAAAARAKAHKAVEAFRATLAKDGLFRLLDENVLGVPMSIRATLDAALSRIAQAVA